MYKTTRQSGSFTCFLFVYFFLMLLSGCWDTGVASKAQKELSTRSTLVYPTNLIRLVKSADCCIVSNYVQYSGFKVRIVGSDLRKLLQTVRSAKSTGHHPTRAACLWLLQFYKGTNMLAVARFQNDILRVDNDYVDQTGNLSKLYEQVMRTARPDLPRFDVNSLPPKSDTPMAEQDVKLPGPKKELATRRELLEKLPPGVPSPIGPDGRYTSAITFTTESYRKEAFRLVLLEANRVAAQLKLPEELPITPNNVVRSFISPFGYAFATKEIGSISTRDFVYYVSVENRFSYLEGTHQNEDAQRFEAEYTLPLTMLDTNQAYHLATQFLRAVSMDVDALNRDCRVTVRTDDVYAHPLPGHFVPIYYVSWKKSEHSFGNSASVRVFTPTETLMQLRVEDAEYILRRPVEFTNIDSLVSGP